MTGPRPRIRGLRRLADDFDEVVARAAVWLAVGGVGGIVGVIGGAAAAALWPTVDRLAAQAAGALLGMALGSYWCATVGRNWMAADPEGQDASRSSHPGRRIAPPRDRDGP